MTSCTIETLYGIPGWLVCGELLIPASIILIVLFIFVGIPMIQGRKK